MSVTDVTTAEFATSVLQRSHQVPVVVDFWAEWCGPCKVLGPVLERLAAEANGSWELAKVDVDQNQQLAMQFGVQGIPTVIAFKDGEAVNRFTGALPEAQVREFVNGVVPSDLDIAAERAHIALEEGDEALAEQTWRAVLERDPAHEIAGTGLAALLLERGLSSEAIEVLERLAPTEGVRQLMAASRLTGGGDLAALERDAADGTPGSLLAFGKGLAAAGAYERGFDTLLEVVSMREPELSDQARLVMLDLFELLGPDHPLTAAYRRRLASALF
ncbi:MAG: thioredoxin [Acidimicrobiia bacterium]|nr:thioredoxin [Acidimicrobiia bacterium]MDH4308867.1 thioredoxin [Acidimicrobiia bacterium]